MKRQDDNQDQGGVSRGDGQSEELSRVVTAPKSDAAPESLLTGRPGEALGQLLHRTPLYKGHVVDLGIDRVLLPNGYTAEIELIRHGGAAAVVPVFEDGTVLLIRQYRHAAGRYLLEIPAGRLEPGEQPEDCARRELQEETGYRAARLTLLLPLLTTPGFTDECISLFLAEGLEAGEAALEADECIERVRVPFPVVLELLRTGGLVDAKSIVGLMTAALRLGWLEAGGP